MKKFNVKVDGVMHIVEVEELGTTSQNKMEVSMPKTEENISTPVVTSPKASVTKGSVLAPLQGTVQTIKVNVGDHVNSGDVVAIIEAMKMENDIPASASGIVKAIYVSKGAKVASGDVILDIE